MGITCFRIMFHLFTVVISAQCQTEINEAAFLKLLCFLFFMYSYFQWDSEISYNYPDTPFLLVGTHVDLREDQETYGQCTLIYSVNINVPEFEQQLTFIQCPEQSHVLIHKTGPF